jgi:hypothetical protein
MISTNLLDNDSAAEGLPMRLVVTVILLSVIIGLSAKAATLFIDDANEKKLKGQLDLIDKRASVLYIQGGAQDIDDPADFSGTMENIHVEIPDNAAFVVFGAMPSPDGNPPGAGNLHTDNVYSIMSWMTAGCKQGHQSHVFVQTALDWTGHSCFAPGSMT